MFCRKAAARVMGIQSSMPVYSAGWKGNASRSQTFSVFAKMRPQPQRQRDDGRGRIALAGSGEHRRAADIKILHAMHFAVGIDHALLRIAPHARAAHMVVAGKLLIGGVGLAARHPFLDAHAAGIVAHERLAKQLQTLQKRPVLQLALFPVKLNARHARRVFFRCMQRDVIVKDRRLFPADIELRGAAQMLAQSLGHPFRRIRRLAGEIGDHGFQPRIGPFDQADAEIHDLAFGDGFGGGGEERLAGGVMLEHRRIKQDRVAALKLRMLHPVSPQRRRLRHDAAGRARIGPEQQTVNFRGRRCR